MVLLWHLLLNVKSIRNCGIQTRMIKSELIFPSDSPKSIDYMLSIINFPKVWNSKCLLKKMYASIYFSISYRLFHLEIQLCNHSLHNNRLLGSHTKSLTSADSLFTGDNKLPLYKLRSLWHLIYLAVLCNLS